MCVRESGVCVCVCVCVREREREKESESKCVYVSVKFSVLIHCTLPSSPSPSVSLGHLLSMETSSPQGGTAEPAEGEGAAVGQVPG